MITPLRKLLLFASSVKCSFDLQKALDWKRPDSPYAPAKTDNPTPWYPRQPQQRSSTSGGEYNPNFVGNSDNRPDKREWYFENNTNSSGLKPVNSTEWFPSLTGSTDNSYNNNRFNPPVNNNSYNSTVNNPLNSDFQEKLALVNPKNYSNNSSSLQRDTKLLSLAHEILSSASSSSSRPLNILHLGSDSGFVPVALAVFSRPVDTLISLDDTSNSMAKENIYRDGKEIFLNRLKFTQVTNLATALIPRAPNNLPYDLIVSSKAISPFTSIPRSLKDSLVPRGIVIYPEEAVTFGNRRIKVDKLDEYGNLRTIKTVEL